MAFNIEAAKADGYTDDEIRAYLASQNQPIPESLEAAPTPAPNPNIPAQAPVDRSEEKWALGEGTGLKALELGAGAYGAKKLLLDPALKTLRAPMPTGAPVAPGAAQKIMGTALGQPNVVSGVPAAAPVAPAQPAMPAPAANAVRGAAAAEGAGAGNWMAQALNMAKQYAPAMARMGAGLGAATYSGGLNTNEEAELARRRAREVEQARRQGWIQ